MPIGEGPDFRGVVNVLEKKAYEGAYKKSTEVPMPDSMKEKVDRAFEYLTEQAAAAANLMMKYLDEGELNYDEILLGFRKGMKDGSIVPVCAVSALTGVGIARMMDLMAKYLPSPAHDGIEHDGFNPRTGEGAQKRVCKDDQPFSAFIYKTIADPFVGKLSLFRIFSGMLTGSTTLYNRQQGQDGKERRHLYSPGQEARCDKAESI